MGATACSRRRGPVLPDRRRRPARVGALPAALASGPPTSALLAGPRRREPGLRREEVARPAGMFVDYYHLTGYGAGMASEESKTEVGLGGVPETLLWTLYHRAVEARRPDAVLRDPMAVELLDRIDYPFERNFGGARLGTAQGQALRARAFDRVIRRFLACHPDGTVVALGEGLETQFWRVDNGRVRWLTVDVAETVELRQRLLPVPSRVGVLTCSALDERWMDEIDPIHGVLVTAQGLLMYLQLDDVHRLVATCARRFPGGALLFDAVPRWVSARTIRGQPLTRHYQIPPMPWGLDAGERRRIRTIHPDVVEVRDVRLPRGRGLFYRHVLPLASATPVVRDWVWSTFPLSVMLVRFRARPGCAGRS